jgi:hypothetical protein
VDVLYERPNGTPVLLREPPGGPHLTTLEDDLGWSRRAGEHLALLLDVALPAATPTARGHDLDDYLFDVVGRLGPVRFDAVFGTKRRGERSAIRVAPSRPSVAAPRRPWMRVRTTAATTSIDWKAQVRDACRQATPVVTPPGPLAVELRFTVSRRRNWTALWSPALDALGPILGTPDPGKPLVADTARVTSLSLHRKLDDQIGPDVLVEVWWRSVPR